MTREFADAWDTSAPGPAFSTKFERAAWMTAWCGTCEWSTGEGYGYGCALSDVAFCDRIPAAWSELDGGSMANRYLCRRWSPAAGYVFLAADLDGMP